VVTAASTDPKARRKRIAASDVGTDQNMDDASHATRGGPETLRYRVPDLQDPAVVVAALSQADFQTVLERVGSNTYACIGCPNGRDGDRERVRMILALDADAESFEGPKLERTVVFDDEMRRGVGLGWAFGRFQRPRHVNGFRQLGVETQQT
jgi:hypothetical protein